MSTGRNFDSLVYNKQDSSRWSGWS